MKRNLDKYFALTQPLLAAVMGVGLFLFMFRSLHWHWTNDTQIFHYDIFLVHHGFSMYRQIVDINMPGCYLFEWIGMSLFGGSDIGWRFYEFLLLAILIMTSVFLTLDRNWFAGLWSGILFAIMHGADGAWMAVERDEVMGILLVAGYALVFYAIKKKRTTFLLLPGLLFGLAALIKPISLTSEAVLVALTLRELGLRVSDRWRKIGNLLIGNAIVAGCAAAWLAREGSLAAFFDRTRSLTSAYVTLRSPGFLFLFSHSVARGMILLLPITIFLFYKNRSWRDWERLSLAGGTFAGFCLYFMQQKGFEYHRYPFLLFSLLWASLEFTFAIRGATSYRFLGMIGFAAGALVLVPFYLTRVWTEPNDYRIVDAMVKDLSVFPKDQLQGRVQCLDGIAGCYSALYRLGVVQSTGLMGDQLLFPGQVTPVVTNLRAETWADWESNPPEVFVETDYSLTQRQSFALFDGWEQFQELIRSDYELVAAWNNGFKVPDGEPLGFRIYKRIRDSPRNSDSTRNSGSTKNSPPSSDGRE